MIELGELGSWINLVELGWNGAGWEVVLVTWVSLVIVVVSGSGQECVLQTVRSRNTESK